MKVKNQNLFSCRYLLLYLYVPLLISCAGTFQKWGIQSVYCTPAYHNRYRIFDNRPIDSTIGHLPVIISTWNDINKNDSISIMRKNKITQELNAYLDTFRLTEALTFPLPPSIDFPSIYYGSSESRFYRRYIERKIVSKSGADTAHLYCRCNGNSQWTENYHNIVTANGNTDVMLIAICAGEYPVSSFAGMFNKKIEIGTDYTVQIPWLTSNKTTVSVVHLTGIIIDASGTIIRSGIEGIMVDHPDVIGSWFGNSQAEYDYSLIEKAINIRRDDLPGKPLQWKVAISHLVIRLLKNE